MVLQNRFAPLVDNTSGPIEGWDSVEDAMKKGGETLRHQEKLRQAWIGDHTWDLINESECLHQNHQAVSSSDEATEYMAYICKD